MTIRQDDSNLREIKALLLYYGFDTKGVTVSSLVSQWQQDYSPLWIRLAVIEALYLGHYKSNSIELILSVWQKKGSPQFRFSHDFECLICRNLPYKLLNYSHDQPEKTLAASGPDNSKLFNKLMLVVSQEQIDK